MAKPLFLYPNAKYLFSATVSATDSYAGSDPNDVLQAIETTYWRPANTAGSKSLIIDLATAVNVSAIGLVGEGLDGVVLTVEADDNLGFTSPETLVDAVNLYAPVNAAWQQTAIPSNFATHRYYRLTFSAIGSAFRVAWVGICAPPYIPYLKSIDADNISDAGKAIVSPAGMYVGANQEKSMREVSLDFGYVTDLGYIQLKLWAAACVAESLPFIFVPDSADSPAYFGWLKDNEFSGPQKTQNGLRLIARQTMITRAK